MPRHVRRSIYSERLSRGQHRYGLEADWVYYMGVHIGATCPILLNRPCTLTTSQYADAAYCYRRSSVVCRSVCRSITIVSPEKKTAELVEVLFGMWTWVGRRNHVFDGVQLLPREGAILRRMAAQCVV